MHNFGALKLPKIVFLDHTCLFASNDAFRLFSHHILCPTGQVIKKKKLLIPRYFDEIGFALAEGEL